MGVLVCAATRVERAACERGIRAGGVSSERFATLLTGVGHLHAARSLERQLARFGRPSLIVSSGFAGAVGPRLAVGDWVTATKIAAVEALENGGIRVTLRQAPRPAIACAIVSSGALVLADAAAVAGARGADAVDMESAALARVAARHGIAFMVLRLVSDTPQRPLASFVAPLAAAMASTTARSKARYAARALRGAAADPRGVARLVREGRELTARLAEGWASQARAIDE